MKCQLSPAISGSQKYCMVKTVCKQSSKEDRMWGVEHINSLACNPHPPSNFAGLQHSERDTYSTLYAAMLNASKVELLLGVKVVWQVKFSLWFDYSVYCMISFDLSIEELFVKASCLSHA